MIIFFLFCKKEVRCEYFFSSAFRGPTFTVHFLFMFRISIFGFECLVKLMKDPLMPIKFKFVQYISMKLNIFLWGFQTDKPMIPFLYDVPEGIGGVFHEDVYQKG